MLFAALCLRAQAAPEAALAREPELDRDEAQRMASPPQAPQVIDLNEINLPPDVERQRLRQLREQLTPAPSVEPALRIKALEGFLDYDEEDQIIYGPGRTRIRYGKFFLEADRVILDARVREAQAEGNVILQVDNDTVYADSARYNFRDGEGVAYNVAGEHKPIYFRAASEKAKPGLPQFQKVSRQESLFRDTEVTTCDFKIPHYHIKGREVVLFDQDRLFFRGATLYIWGVPVFYLPVYSRSMIEGSPWFVQLGYGSRTGARVRLGYAYQHMTEEPSFEDDGEYVTRSQGKARVFVDYLTEIGLGGGMDYLYDFEFGKHKGELEVYGIHDGDREVVGASPPSGSSSDDDLFGEAGRWRFLWRHRTQITEDLSLIVNVDEFSDPDIFYDVLDLFDGGLTDRERQTVRRARTALTWVQEEYVVRLMADVKDRIGLDRYNDYSNPRDNNLDYNLEPYRELEDAEADGISKNRWGRVSSKMPQLDIASRWLPIGPRPLYYQSEVHFYNSLDKGLNVVDDEDDAYVQGVELYQAVMYQWKLSERYVLLAKLGFGLGGADRDHSLGMDLSGPYPLKVDGLTFVDDDETFLVGKKKRNYGQLKNFYAWADSSVQLNARFSDALTGFLRWRWRETTSDFIGDFYADLGDLTFREDLYDYKTREHWFEGDLTYRLVQPLLAVSTRAGYNLASRSEVFPNEKLAYWNVGAKWANQRETLIAQARLGWRQIQVFHPSDPEETTEDKVTAEADLFYRPAHLRWYTGLRLSHEFTLGEGIERDSDSDLTYFSDEDTRTEASWVYGRELGPKWDTEFEVQWDDEVGGLREVSWLLQRDLHDATALFKITSKNDSKDSDSRGESGGNEMDMSFGLKLKLPVQEAGLGAQDIQTVRQHSYEPILAE